ncbi:NUDIX hydrolase [Nakamurella lactea]|uniref:NUDIX hydrolase n=1 Tax=Nakamurella lactea TaxID=459515 RepID=UPI0004243286|nr:NUDIX domain-containing protein [Nakamurella lactea]
MTHAWTHADALAALTSWTAPDHHQAALQQAYLGFLLARADATERACAPGHLTASAVLLSADRDRTLLTLHPRVGRWLQLGGHCEDADSTLRGAALREATEESGIAGLTISPRPIHLEVHPITCSLGVPTRHFDVRFVALAAAGAEPVISAESDDLRWWPVEALPADTDPGLRAAVRAAVEHPIESVARQAH